MSTYKHFAYYTGKMFGTVPDVYHDFCEQKLQHEDYDSEYSMTGAELVKVLNDMISKENNNEQGLNT